jgi:streptogramin lyase
MRISRLIAACVLVALSGCAGQTGLPAHVGSDSSVLPKVIQKNQPPVNWVQFKPGTASPNYVGVIAGPNKTMWFSDYSRNGLVSITMTGKATEFSLPASTAPFSLAMGADKNVYVEGTVSHAIDQVTPTGIVHAYSIPSNDVPIGGMALGPDGNVWFTEEAHIARISPSGTIAEFAYPSGAHFQSGGGGVAVGSDKNVWFVEANAGIIGKIDPTTSAITEYPTTTSPIGSCFATGIAAAKNGKLYFACAANQNSSTGYVGQITTSGAQAYFANPYGFSMYPEDVTLGPDKQIWIAPDQFTQLLIAEFNVGTHAFTTYTTPDFSYLPLGMTAGPDGNMWGTNQSGTVDVYVLNVLDVAPAALTFSGTGQSQPLTVTESGATSWTATSSKPSVATVAQGGSSNVFNVTSVAVGTCTVKVTDGRGNIFDVGVTVQ